MGDDPARHPFAVETLLALQVAGADRVMLRTDVHRPAGDRATPVILLRTPYGTGNVAMLRWGRLMAGLGFATVLQNVRGRYGSTGTFEPFRHETQDGLATLEWLRQQPWCDGRVIPFGISYSTYTACALWGREPPSGIHFPGLVSIIAMARPWSDFYRGGALVLHWALPWSLVITGPRQRDLRQLDLPRHVKGILEELPRQLGMPPRPWLDWVRQRDSDSDYWRSSDTLPNLRKRPLPILHVGGWYDFSLASTFELHREMVAVSPAASQRLIVGPWEHNEVFSALLRGLAQRSGWHTRSGEHDAWLAAQLASTLHGWIDPAGPDPGRVAGPPIQVWRGEAGTAGEWVSLHSWPPAAGSQRFYLRSAAVHGGIGRLTAEESGSHEPASCWWHDPDDPVPTVGGRCWAAKGWAAAGPLDQSGVESRDDVVTYTSGALESDLEVGGVPVLHLCVAPPPGEGPADFCAKLVDVQADGRPLWVADGVVRVKPSASDDPMTVLVELGEIVYRFRRHHQIRIELAASNFPQFDRTALAGERRLYHHAGCASYLELPVLQACGT